MVRKTKRTCGQSQFISEKRSQGHLHHFILGNFGIRMSCTNLSVKGVAFTAGVFCSILVFWIMRLTSQSLFTAYVLRLWLLL